MASPQLLWLPRLPNDESPLLINKIRGNSQAPPPLPPIYSLPAATAGEPPPPPPGVDSLRYPPLYERSFNPLQSSNTSLKATKTTITPIWSAKNSHNGPFRAIFGANLMRPPSRTTTSALRPSSTELPLQLHHQRSFTFPPIAAPAKQSMRYRHRNYKLTNKDAHTMTKDIVDSATPTGDDGKGIGGEKLPPPISARPPHRRRKKRCINLDGDLSRYTDPSTSDDGTHGQLPRKRGRKKVRWAGGR